MSANYQVFNKTTQAAISEHDDAGAAKNEAQRLNNYHNNDVFDSRPVKESQKLADQKQDPDIKTPQGDGTLPGPVAPVVDDKAKQPAPTK